MSSLTKVLHTSMDHLPSLPLRWILAGADFLTLAVMVGTFLNDAYGSFQYITQGMAALLILLYVPFYLRFKPRIAPEFYLAGLFVVWCFCSGMLIASDDKAVMHYSIRIARFLLLAMSVGGFAMLRRDPSRGFMVMASLGGYLAYLTKTSAAFGDLVAGSVRYQEAMGMNPNTVGLFLLWAIVSIVFLWGTVKSFFIRSFLAGAALVFVFFIVTTASRKSFLGFLFFLTLWLLFCYGKKIIKNTMVFVLALLVVVGCYYLSVRVVPDTYLGKKFQRTQQERGLGETRSGMYAEGWEMFLENPIAGVGLGNFMVHSVFKQYTHSDSIEALSTTGFIGFALYFSIYIILWRRTTAVRKRTSDLRIQYQMGVYQALILTFFAVGIGMIHFLSLSSWLLLALMICHTSALEHSVSVVRKKRVGPGNSFSLQRGMRRSA